MKYTINYSGRFKKSYKPHILSGKYAGIWECHIEPDWLLLWKQNDTELTLLLLDTGTHSDVF
jgi:mRNA interferase YafQ